MKYDTSKRFPTSEKFSVVVRLRKFQGRQEKALDVRVFRYELPLKHIGIVLPHPKGTKWLHDVLELLLQGE